MTQGLAQMNAECKKLFKVAKEMCWYGNLSYTERELRPVTLETLEHLSNDKLPGHHHFLQDCVDNPLTEVKEKFKAWSATPERPNFPTRR